MEERRQYERTPTSIKVQIHHPAFGTILGYARDISDGGAQVLVENQVAPPVGTEVQVLFNKITGPVNQEPVGMKVMHSNKNVLGLMFV